MVEHLNSYRLATEVAIFEVALCGLKGNALFVYLGKLLGHWPEIQKQFFTALPKRVEQPRG
jgi:hypothetical protein